MSKASEILDGAKNSIFTNKIVEEVAAKRKSICDICPANSANSDKDFFKPGKFYSKIRKDAHCTHCACNLHMKQRSLKTSCPIGKWKAV